MKIDRLLGILSILAAGPNTTAPALAERFEVSRKTIQRDINDLCMAGFPVVTEPGRGGGLSLMPGFAWEKTLLSGEEMRLVLAGVGALGSVSNLTSLDAKLRRTPQAGLPLEQEISIDLASFYRDSLTEKIAGIRQAIGARRKIRFDYYYEKGDCVRTIAPYRLLFRWNAWYVQGLCDARAAVRTFKLNRLWNLRVTEEAFEPSALPEAVSAFAEDPSCGLELVALFEPEAKYRLIEEYGPCGFSVQEDGRLRLEWTYQNCAFALQWLLSFGGAVEVLSPPSLREELAAQARAMLARHTGL